MADNPLLGEDFAGALDIDPSMSTTSGRRCLAEAIARRWYDLAGSLFYDREYGKGLEGFLNAAVDTDQLASDLADEARKDERVEDCSVTVSRVGEQLKISGRITDGAGPFPLTVLVSQLDVKVLLEGV